MAVWIALGAAMQFLPEAQAETSVSVLATDPQAEGLLGVEQPFYARIAYRSDEPVRIWIRPYAGGRPVASYRAGASLQYTGVGEALGWFSLPAGAVVDELRVFAGGGAPWREWQVAVQPLSLRVSRDAPDVTGIAPWVQELQDNARVAQRAARESAQRVDGSAGSTVLVSGLVGGVLLLLAAGVAAPFWAMWRWRGGWRLAAAVPAGVMGFVLIRIVSGIASDPTSHNLWPFEILTSGIVTLVILATLAVARRFTTKTGPPGGTDDIFERIR